MGEGGDEWRGEEWAREGMSGEEKSGRGGDEWRGEEWVGEGMSEEVALSLSL